jgi:nucleoid-associated protein YgaU
MKKFSTIHLLLAAILPVAGLSAALAATPDTSKQHCAFLPDAPDKHEVVSGDTLWGISATFLQNPWCWPEVWGMNKEDIRNPHWIYPGQIVYFDRTNGRLRLGNVVSSGSNAGSAADQDMKLTPQFRTEGLGSKTIPAIPSSIVEPFLVQPLIVEENELQVTPRIVAIPENRVLLAQGDKAYVRGDLKGGTSFQVFRPGHALKDPETKLVIGYEAAFLGTMKLERAAKADDANGVHTFRVGTLKEEIAIGDRLVPVPPTPILNYVPHPPEQKISARVVEVYGGVQQAGQNQIVSINRGARDGLNLGTVLTLFQFGGIVPDTTENNKLIKLPDERYGNLFIFRIFDRISYGLVMQVSKPVQVGDVASSPE